MAFNRDKETKRQRDEVKETVRDFPPLRLSVSSSLRLSRRSALSLSKGFTLTELLVVIGIIIILIGILLPVVGRIRIAAYTTDTANEISQLSNACGAYYSTFHAYPGPFSADDTTGGTANTALTGFGVATLTQIYINGAYSSVSTDSAPGATVPWCVSGAQNLVLGLMGGIRPILPAATPQTFAFAPAEVGLGPMSLNPNNPTRTLSFFPNGSNYLMWSQLNGPATTANNGVSVFQQTTGSFQNLSGSPSSYSGTPFTDQAGNHAADGPIPVFVDRFPAPGPLPILYLRARSGSKGIVWDNITVQQDYNGITPADYQYDLREIGPYVDTCIGLSPTDSTGAANTHNLIGINSFAGSVLPNNKAPHPQQVQNAGQYFINTSITPTDQTNNASINYTGRPRAVDQFILISAGPDGVYGTSDDITSFGSVSN